jgi:polar amino acid transport system substrate-binding protein
MPTRLAVLIALACVAPRDARADDDKPLVVGVFSAEPSMISNKDGSWSGFCIDSWRAVAETLDLKYELRVYDPAILSNGGLEAAGVDVLLCQGPNPRAEKIMDVTHAFYTDGLAIATRPEPASGLSRVIDKVLSLRFLRNLGILLVIIVVVGIVVWRIERHSSPDEFGGSTLSGIGGGVFWTVESLFAKPKPLSRRVRSRLVSLFWVFTCMLLISGVTAKLSSEFTVSQLSGTVGGVKDLQHARVGVGLSANGHSASARFLAAHGIPYRAFAFHAEPTPLEALDRGELDAVLDGGLGLRYRANKDFAGRIIVLPETVQPTQLGFAVRVGNPLRKKLDLALLKLAEQGVFKTIARQYGGADD